MAAWMIWKKALDERKVGVIQELELPPNSRVLGFGQQPGVLILWFQFREEDMDKPTVTERFLLAFTGGPTEFPEPSMETYHGTVQVGSLVYHLFWIGN